MEWETGEYRRGRDNGKGLDGWAWLVLDALCPEDSKGANEEPPEEAGTWGKHKRI